MLTVVPMAIASNMYKTLACSTRFALNSFSKFNAWIAHHANVMHKRCTRIPTNAPVPRSEINKTPPSHALCAMLDEHEALREILAKQKEKFR